MQKESYLKSVLKNKSLIWLFAITDLKLRYRNSVLGFLWSILEPLLMLTVLYSVFTYLLPSNIQHYPLFLLISLITWNSFARGTSMASNSIIARKGVVLTVYLPRMILPVSSVITSFLMMFLEIMVFVGFIVAFQFNPPFTAILLPFVFIPLFLLTLGISYSLAVLNVMYRDISYIWAVIIQAGFFLTPIIYNVNIFPQNLRFLVMLNPMSQIITWSRDFTLYDKTPQIDSLLYTFAVCIGIFMLGYFTFKKLENKMVDKL